MLNKFFEAYPLTDYVSPKDITIQQLNSEIIEVRGKVDLSAFNLSIEETKRVKIAEINGNYFLFSKGLKFVREYKTLINNESVKCEVHHYPSADVMEDKFERLFGVPYSEYQDVENIYEEFSPSPLTESRDSNDKIDEASLVIKKSGPSRYLDKYLSSYSKGDWPKIPILLGNSGIAKSAIVEESVKKNTDPDGWGYRLVTLKVGFIDKTDLMGFVETKDVDMGNGTKKRMAQDSPMEELLTACDSFIDTCRRTLQESDIEDIKTNGSPEEINAIAQMEEYSKSPVIFLDEINRAPSSILNPIMKLINQKELNTYTFDKVPFIAAANSEIDVEDESDLMDMYKVEDMDDPAIVDRFIAVNVSHTDETVITSAVNYLSEKYQSSWEESHPFDSEWDSLKDFLNHAHDLEIFYNPEFFTSPDESDGDKDSFKGKFPTFRAWEDMIKYLTSKNRGDHLNADMFKALLGSEAGRILRQSIRFMSPVKEESEDLHKEILEESFQAGIPALLTGKFGIAKTAKINEVAKNNNADVHDIDLSTQDRTTIRGFPSKVNLIEKVFYNLLETNVVGTFTDISEEDPLFPESTTSFSPFDFQYKVQECLRENKPLVIVYDEVNRADEILMSSVFDGISNGMVQGVDISELVNRGLVRIIAAGNTGADYETTELDAAFMARFAVAEKTEVNESDFESFLTWAKDNFHPVVVSNLEDVKDQFLEVFNSEEIEDDVNINTNFSSFRTLHQYDTFIKNNIGFLIQFDKDETVFSNDSEIVDSFINRNYLSSGDGTAIGLTMPDGSVEEFETEELQNLIIRKDPALQDDDFYNEVVEGIKILDEESYRNEWISGIRKLINPSSESFFMDLTDAIERDLLLSNYTPKITDDYIMAQVLKTVSGTNPNSETMLRQIGMYLNNRYSEDAVTMEDYYDELKAIEGRLSENMMFPDIKPLEVYKFIEKSFNNGELILSNPKDLEIKISELEVEKANSPNIGPPSLPSSYQTQKLYQDPATFENDFEDFMKELEEFFGEEMTYYDEGTLGNFPFAPNPNMIVSTRIYREPNYSDEVYEKVGMGNKFFQSGSVLFMMNAVNPYSLSLVFKKCDIETDLNNSNTKYKIENQVYKRFEFQINPNILENFDINIGPFDRVFDRSDFKHIPLNQSYLASDVSFNIDGEILTLPVLFYADSISTNNSNDLSVKGWEEQIKENLYNEKSNTPGTFETFELNKRVAFMREIINKNFRDKNSSFFSIVGGYSSSNDRVLTWALENATLESKRSLKFMNSLVSVQKPN